MGEVSRYWMWVKIDSSGKCQRTELTDVRAFFQQEFPELNNTDDVPDREIQRKLMQWLQDNDSRSQMASLSLRCFISNQIKDISLKMSDKFAKTHNLTSFELLVSTLDSTRRVSEISTNSDELSLTNRILQTFDAQKSNLSTWTIRMFKSDKKVKQLLLEHGIEQVTDWMILNYMTPGRLEKMLKNNLYSQTEINQALLLLDSYHQIYRTQLLQNRRAGTKSRYPEPTELQLRQIAEKLSPKPQTLDREAIQKVREKLQDIASIVRQERIRTRTKIKSVTSWDNSQQTVEVYGECENEQSELLVLYRSSFDSCFAGAVKKVIENRMEYFQAKRTAKSRKKAENFLQALYLFHCQAVPMKEIAPKLGLIDQPYVSRLLELKNLRSDIARNTLLCLKDCIFKLIQSQVDFDLPSDWESKVEDFLQKELQAVIKQAEQEASNGQNRAMNSQLARAICLYLDNHRG